MLGDVLRVAVELDLPGVNAPIKTPKLPMIHRSPDGGRVPVSVRTSRLRGNVANGLVAA
jgi:hypothetical protein